MSLSLPSCVFVATQIFIFYFFGRKEKITLFSVALITKLCFSQLEKK